MTDQSSIFGQTDSQTPANTGISSIDTNAPNIDPVANLLGSIKNERGEQKYKTIEEAMVALRHSQEYIPQLTHKLSEKDAELSSARAEAARIAELERSLAALTQSQSPNQSTAAQGLTKEDVAELVNQTLTRQQTESVQKNNVGKVVQDMVKQYGADAQKTYEAKAAELGMTVQQLNTLAASTPQAVLRLMGVSGATQPKEQAPATQFNSEAFQPQENSFIGRNPKPVMIGATSQDIKEEAIRSKKMVEELHAQGKSVHDLTDPKLFFKYFK